MDKVTVFLLYITGLLFIIIAYFGRKTKIKDNESSPFIQEIQGIEPIQPIDVSLVGLQEIQPIEEIKFEPIEIPTIEPIQPIKFDTNILNESLVKPFDENVIRNTIEILEKEQNGKVEEVTFPKISIIFLG